MTLVLIRPLTRREREAITTAYDAMRRERMGFNRLDARGRPFGMMLAERQARRMERVLETLDIQPVQ